MDAFAASPFALVDVHGSLRLVTDAVHEDDALCLALVCRAMRDALGARFPACPRAGGRAVAKLAARVTADGVLDLSTGGLHGGLRGGLRALPEGVGRLAYLPAPGLRKLVLSFNRNLAALPAGLWTLTGLEELDLYACGLRALPEGIGRLAGLRKLNLFNNKKLTALPAGLCSLAGLEELNLSYCGLTALPEGVAALIGLKRLDLDGNGQLTALPEGLCALAGLEELDLAGCGLVVLPEGIGRLAGLKKLDLFGNEQLIALPAGLGRLCNLKELRLWGCLGLAALRTLHDQEGLPALLAHLAAQGGEPAAGEAG
jgi:Leucine-rich repeat (LRR) protein